MKILNWTQSYLQTKSLTLENKTNKNLMENNKLHFYNYFALGETAHNNPVSLKVWQE